MADLAADLTAGQIDDFRDNWIRDRWTAPATGLSEYNRSRKANFFSDPQLQTIYDRVVEDWAEELEAVKVEKESERLLLGDTEADAETKADKVREQAFFRLMRVLCRKEMKDDPGFRGSLTVGQQKGALDALLNEWRASNIADIAWVRSRSGEFAGYEFERA